MRVLITSTLGKRTVIHIFSFVLKLKSFDLVENENDRNLQNKSYVIKCLDNKYVSFQTD